MPNKSNKLIIEFHYTYLLMALSFILTGYYLNIIVFTTLIIIHELGHYIVAKILKFNVQKIIIYPYGGITKIDDLIDKEINKELLIASAGIITQFIFYLIICYLHKNNYLREYTYNLYTIYNNSIISFNLLPIIPLDGSKIINLLLNKITYYNLSNYLTIIISIITLIIIITLNIYTYNYTNIMIFTISLRYIYIFIKNLKYLYNRFILEKILYPNKYNKPKIIWNKNKLYRNKKNLLYGFLPENKYLLK